MPDADDALRAEIEKVRDRARLQALAQGLSTDEADRRGQKAVEEFCGKWGIRAEMVGPPRGPRPAPAPVRAVDLGSSPLRSTTNPSMTQAIRIADLLRKGKEAGGAAGAPAPAPAPAAAGAGGKSSLAGLLDRVRAQSFPDAAPAGAPAAAPAAYRPAPAPPPAAPPPPLPARPSSPPPLVISQAPAPVPAAAAGADRRRALLEEFDRTYSEVQTMIEQRIGVADVAMGDAPRGLAQAFERAAEGGVGPEEAKILAQDVQRLRDHLRQMMTLCDEFLSHLDEFTGRRAGQGRS